jgi:hypothetical protein
VNPFNIHYTKINQAFASTAGGLRNWNAAVFSPLKKYASHFFNSDFVETDEKKAANPVTGKSECIRMQV